MDTEQRSRRWAFARSRLTPAQFTVEAFYKHEANGGYRTVVGRDARNVAAGNGDLAAFYLQIRPDDSVGVTFTDVSGYTHSAYSPPGWIYAFNWNTDPEGTNASVGRRALTAVSDGDTLRVHVNNQLVAWTDLTYTNSSPLRESGSGRGEGRTCPHPPFPFASRPLKEP